jgi:hypothetical protein
VSESETCACGHVKDEHGQDKDFPGSMACNVDDCDCIAYEHEPEESGAPRAEREG